jgi:hypothetical protein
MTVMQCLSRAVELQTVSESWRLDAELLLAAALDCPREMILARLRFTKTGDHRSVPRRISRSRFFPFSYAHR